MFLFDCKITVLFDITKSCEGKFILRAGFYALRNATNPLPSRAKTTPPEACAEAFFATPRGTGFYYIGCRKNSDASNLNSDASNLN